MGSSEREAGLRKGREATEDEDRNIAGRPSVNNVFVLGRLLVRIIL